MMKRARKLLASLLAAALCASCLSGIAPVSAATQPTSFATEFANPMYEDSMLKVRYWLPSGYPASSPELLEEIDREMAELAEAGYSTVELANVYEGLTESEYKALEEGDGEESYLFGSSYWTETLRQVLKSAKTYGMTVDITMGPHWPAASDEIDIESDAVMKEAVYAANELSAGDRYTQLTRDYVAITKSDASVNLLGVYAAKYESTKEFSKTSGYGDSAVTTKWLQYAVDDSTMVKLEADENGNYDFTAPEDNYVVIEVYEHSTGATIKYSTYNNPDTNYTGYCLDMYNEAGAQEFIRYFEEHVVDDEIEALLKEVGGNFFEDNFSYSAQNIWTSTLMDTFNENSGYDMLDVLPYTLGIPSNGHSSERNSTGIDLESSAPFVIANDTEYKYNRIRGDMIDSWAGCYLNQHIATIMDWAENRFGMGFRTQTYGGNIDTGLCAATVTIPEGESIGFSDGFDGFSMLAAGRDMGGNTPILSSEFAASFSQGGAYGYAWDDLMKAAYKNYSAGVNALVFHGYSYLYSPESVWPGNHAFGTACSGTWSSRDPQWTQIADLSGNLRRFQYTLQQGVQKTDVAVYESMGNAQGGGPFYDGSALTAEGYSYQLFTPELLTLDSAAVTNGVLNENGPAYKAMVIDNETAMSKETMSKLISFADAGLALVFANQLPCISTSLTEDNAEIAAMMQTLLEKDNVVAVESTSDIGRALLELGVAPAAQKAESDTAVLPIHRSMDGGEIYYFYNTSDQETTVTVTMQGDGAPYLLNTWTGEVIPLAEYTSDGKSVTTTVTLTGNDAVLFGIGAAFGSGEEVHATKSTVKLGYDNGTLTAKVDQNGPYLVTTNEGKVYTGNCTDLASPIEINDWDLSVESWTSGDPDDAKVTAKEIIYEGHTDAVPWSSIPEVGGNVSGIGRYTTTFEMTDTANTGATLSFTGVGETFQVYLNGKQLPAADQVTKQVDLDGYLKEGENELTVVVATSLQNAVNAPNSAAKVYGIVGTTLIQPYQKVQIKETANKAILQAVIDYAVAQKNAPSFSQVIGSVQASFTAALDQAQEINSSLSATQQQVDLAWQALMTEIHKLGFIQGDKAALASLVTLGNSFHDNIDNYTPATAQPFTTALAAAQAVLEDQDALQGEVDAAHSALLDAMMNLRYKADKSILEAVLARADKIDLSVYTQASVAAFASAKAEAEAALNDQNAEQAGVDEAADNLQAAIDQLTCESVVPAPTVHGDASLTSAGSSPKTGDTAPLAAGFAVLALIGAACALTSKRKR